MRVEALLDRIVRGRAWIPVLAVMLIGIVAMQVEVLKLGASVGRSMNVATELAGQNQIEAAIDSQLASPSRVERLAAQMGMTEPGPTDNHFLSANVSLSRAIAGIHPVNPSAFASNLQREQAADDPATPAASAATAATQAADGTGGAAADAATAAANAAGAQAAAAGGAAGAAAPPASGGAGLAAGATSAAGSTASGQ